MRGGFDSRHPHQKNSGLTCTIGVSVVQGASALNRLSNIASPPAGVFRDMGQLCRLRTGSRAGHLGRGGPVWSPIRNTCGIQGSTPSAAPFPGESTALATQSAPPSQSRTDPAPPVVDGEPQTHASMPHIPLHFFGRFLSSLRNRSSMSRGTVNTSVRLRFVCSSTRFDARSRRSVRAVW